MVFAQQLTRMAEAHAFRVHHPVDYAPTFAARSLTVPDVLDGIDAQARIGVLVERAQADQVLAAPSQLHPARFGQPLDLLLRDSRHSLNLLFRVFGPFPENPVKRKL